MTPGLMPVPAHAVLNKSGSSDFYAHHWVLPHRNVFGLKHGYFEDSSHYHPASPVCPSQPGQQGRAFARDTSFYGQALGPRADKVPGSVWAAGESV